MAITFLTNEDKTVLEQQIGERVSFAKAQSLTDEQKARARDNIGAAAVGDGGGTVEGAVLYNEQSLTDEQQAQARENIDACLIDDTAVGTDAWSSANIADKLCNLGIATTATGDFIDVADVSTLPLLGLSVYGKTTLTGTGFVSSGDNGSITIGVTGKNIFGGEAFAAKLKGLGGQLGEDSIGRYVAVGPYITGTLIKGIFKPNKRYNLQLKIRLEDNEKHKTNLLGYYTDGNTFATTKGYTLGDNYFIYKPVSDGTKTLSSIQVSGGYNVVFYYDECGIFEYSSGAAFEEFKGQLFTISTPNNLRGIPVGSGGNYTENEQQWVSDEINIATGEIVPRIGVIDSYNGEEITGAYMSSTGGLDIGAKVLYVLDKPAEPTYISAEELEVYKSVCTVKPYTKFSNNADAGMDVKYVIDTKTYVDKKALETILHGKTAVFDGDSICEGSSARDYLSGWAGRIGANNAMVWKNYAVGGGTITKIEGRYCIGANIDTIHSQYPNLDYLILEGGTNDADSIGADGLGTFSENDYGGSYGTTTFSGAFETLLYKAVTYYPTAKIGYIVPHKMGNASSIRRTYFDRAIELCKKWGVPYIDLWSIAHLNRHLTAHYDSSLDEQGNIDAGKLFVDTQHLSPSGYEVITPKIEAWMKTL